MTRETTPAGAPRGAEREPRLTLVVALFVHPGHEAEFERFEKRATDLMGRHGGRIERRIRIAPGGASDPDEVHVVTFPDQAALDRYQRDPDRMALADLRTRAVRQTIVWRGVEGGATPP